MSLKALITTIVLGSSSLALAQPAARVDIRDHRAPSSWVSQRYITLASSLRLKPGRNVVDVSQLRPVSMIKLEAQSGRTKIDRVVIELGNGQRKVVRAGGIVTAGNPLTIDLPGGKRNVKSVAIFGQGGRRASIDILAI